MRRWPDCADLRTATCRSAPPGLPPIECDVLEPLIRSVDGTVTHEELSLHLSRRCCAAAGRAATMHISPLRRKRRTATG